MRRDAVRMLLLVGLILLTGCATTPPARICPVAYGSHGPLNKSFGLHHRFVVWGIDRFVGPVSPAVMSAVMETLQRNGQTVIEDARFEQVYNEHVRQHTYGFDDATVARIGKLVGADSILFVDPGHCRVVQTIRVLPHVHVVDWFASGDVNNVLSSTL